MKILITLLVFLFLQILKESNTKLVMHFDFKYILFIILFLATSLIVYAQPVKKKLPGSKDTTKKTEINIPDTKPDIFKTDTIGSSNKSLYSKEIMDSIRKVSISSDSIRSKSGMDSIVVYSAKDSVNFKFKTKIMRLRGESKMNFKKQKLEAEVIIIDFNESNLDASGVKDSNNNVVGFPKFIDGGETYVGERIKYNFKNKQGTISLGETELQEGFYFGSKIKRISENEAFIQDGRYTTCDAPHPHFYFGSPEMKVIANDRVFLDPLVFYVEDMPLMIIPIGLFFPSESGRSSGLIVPSYYFTRNRGVNIKDIGYYFALSDYYDTKVTFDLFTKGGYSIKNEWRWNLTNVLRGNLNLEYGKTRWDPNQPFQTNLLLNFTHNQTLSPSENISAYINYATQDFFKNTTIDLRKTVTQEMRSNASYSKSFQNGSSFSISYGRSQNIITSAYDQNSGINYSLPQFKPLHNFLPQGSVPDWVRDFNFTYNVNANWNETKYLKDVETRINADSVFKWQDTIITPKMYIQHRPSISISPRLGYFTLQPSFSFSANNYFRRVKKSWDAKDSSLNTFEEKGFFTEYTYNYGVSLSTKLFGIIKPRLFGLNALRHTFQPTINYSFTPDLSDPSLGFWDKVITNKDTIQYSRFERDASLSSSRESQSLNYSIVNKFDAKVQDTDTSETNIELLTWDLAGSYDFTKKDFKFSDIRMSFRAPAITLFSFSSSAAFSMYDFTKIFDTISNSFNYQLIDKTLMQTGRGILRLTNFNISLSANFSFTDLKIGTTTLAGNIDTSSSNKDSIGLGERFAQRINYKEEKADIFGDQTGGYNAIKIPLSFNFDLNFGYSDPMSQFAAKRNITRTLTANIGMSMQVTETWSLRTSLYYDFINDKLSNPVVNLAKELHCWQLSVDWNPIGAYKGFYLRFGILNPQLKDLQYEKRNYSIY
jgi:hypothetical protein